MPPVTRYTQSDDVTIAYQLNCLQCVEARLFRLETEGRYWLAWYSAHHDSPVSRVICRHIGSPADTLSVKTTNAIVLSV